MKMTALAHAKLNLHLAVGALQSDGYHRLQSLFARLELADTIDVHVSPGPFSVSVTGLEAYCKSGDDTMSKTARLWHEATGSDVQLSVSIEKRIAVQSGLGGGSSDAAALLSLLQSLSPLTDSQRMAIALGVGSDVPFFLNGGNAAVVEGRGEQVTAIPSRALDVLLVMPKDFSISTKEAYAHLDRLRTNVAPSFVDPSELVTIYNKSCPTWAGSLYNDFYLTVSQMPIYQALAALGRDLSGYSTISGSGACWYFVSEDASSVAEARKRVQRDLASQVVCWQSRLL